MNYAAMYEYEVDRHSGQFKAPFNQIANEARVFTYIDTAVISPNSDTRYSIVFMDLQAEPLTKTIISYALEWQTSRNSRCDSRHKLELVRRYSAEKQDYKPSAPQSRART
jgi:hypothetical protein